MGGIGQGIKLFHVMGIIIAFSFCLCNIPLWEVVSADEISGTSALTLVESSDTDDDDGIVTNEETNNEVVVEDESLGIFEPTSEWKTVKQGQKIPAGLHVRMNFQTGEKEAKLLDEPGTGKKKTNQWDAGEKMGIINTEKQRFTREELKKALQDFKIDEADEPKTEPKDSEGNKLRSYDELQEVLKQMKMSIKTEAEIVTWLMNKLKDKNIDSEEMKTHLIDMEYYVHQFDNARLFCDLNGMQVILALMNSTESDIRTKAALVLGAALQSNAQVQVNAMENGVMQNLLRLIVVDTSSDVKKRSLFALSTLLRQFPHAQKQFLKLGGLSAVAELFLKCGDEQLKVKIITLLTDLVQEKDYISADFDESDNYKKEKFQQYSEVQIREALQASGWCTHLSSLMHQLSGHDSTDKVITAMMILKETCKHELFSLRQTLQSLSSQYSNLAKIDKEQGETDTFFDSIYNNIEKLLDDVKFQREDL